MRRRALTANLLRSCHLTALWMCVGLTWVRVTMGLPFCCTGVPATWLCLGVWSALSTNLDASRAFFGVCGSAVRSLEAWRWRAVEMRVSRSTSAASLAWKRGLRSAQACSIV